ncbi:MAG: hypothetical protein RLZZ151_217 [Pseudomonadota bacterium]
MFLRLIAFLILATLISCKNAIAETIEDGRYWFSLYTQGPLPKENFYWSLDIHPRWREEGRNFDTLILRPSLIYKITPKTSIWTGYDTINNHPAGQSSFQENRLWEQVMHQFEQFGALTLTVRTRFEQRDREDYSDIAHRLRQMVRATTPSSLHQQLSWVIWDELFINLNQTDWGVMRGTDQNRLFLGANWKFDELSNLEVGYINQYVNGKTIDRENHIISSTIRFNF